MQEIPHPDEEILDKVINEMCSLIINAYKIHPYSYDEEIHRAKIRAYKEIENNAELQALIKKRMNLPKRWLLTAEEAKVINERNQA